MKQIENIKEHGGWLQRFTHVSTTCQCDMTFSIFLPPHDDDKKIPAIFWLSGLTCTDDNFRTKAGAQRYAAELGIALIIPDTSPRGDKVPDAKERYDLGHGAGFYINATQMPWKKNYHMYDYICKELPSLISKHFPMVSDRKSIMGHSMGGHGALICALKNPGMFESVSAFSPICRPTQCAWGTGIFKAYLGEDETHWKNYDTGSIIEKGCEEIPCLIDQGTDDEFFPEQLHTEDLQQICDRMSFPIDIRFQEGYDHSYHFISTFIGEHMNFHHSYLNRLE